jgi:UDP:flavonoid glycosyltransferase YjiC (YdhE family)
MTACSTASDLRSVEEFIEPELGPVLQAPLRAGSARNPVRRQVSYASLLNNSGFDDVIGLAGRLRAWRNLISGARPDLVLADHAPTALLAARSLDLPRALVGTGFTVPPFSQPFPRFQPELAVSDEVLQHNEQAVLHNLNRALQRLALPPLGRLQDLGAGALRLVLSYRELDHYEVAREEPYLGVPLTARGAAPAWPAGEQPKILAYLRPAPHLQQLLEALARTPARVLLRIGDLPAAKVQPFLRPGLVVTDQPVDMQQAARECDAFVNYASHGFVAEMLLSGKPGLLLPDLLERRLVARRAAALGAVLAAPEQGAFNVSEALVRIVHDAALRDAAGQFAARYAAQDRAQIPAQIVDRLEPMLSAVLPARPGTS